jgi:hypothetical protein
MKDYVIILKNNFPTLNALNTDYLNFYSNLLFYNAGRMKLIGYLKFSLTLIISVCILLTIYQNLNYRDKQL